MFRISALAILAALAIGSVHADTHDDFGKQAIDDTQPLEIELQPSSTPVPSDLTLDLAFNGSGLRALWPPAGGWSATEDSVRTFPWLGSITFPPLPPIPGHLGYYIVGKQKNAAGDKWRATIARVRLDGTLDTNFGNNGWIVKLELADIVDAQIVGDKAYILANTLPGGALPPLTRVACIDLSTPTGVDCFPFLAGVQTWGITSTTVRTAAYGQRLAYDSRYGLFVAARIMNSSRGQELGIAKISAANGSLNTGFRDGGYNIGLPSWAHQTQAEVTVNALAVTPAGYPGGTRLYVAGQLKATAADHDGFIIGMAPSTGATATNWGWNRYYYEDDNAGNKKDAITALTVLRNGRIVFAGWSETDNTNTQPMIMGRIHANGTYDAGFCASNPHRGVRGCLVDPPWQSGPLLSYKPHSMPVAIAERRQNRDLVVAQRFQNNGNHPIWPDDGRVRTLLQQFSSTGNTLHAARTISYPNGGSATPWSRPFDMYLGPAGPKPEVLVVAGTRHWSGSDYDMTITHLTATDTIFANQFGTATSD